MRYGITFSFDVFIDLIKMNFKKQFFQDNQKSNKSKFNFLKKKETTISSLFEVEHFLTDLKHLWKYIKLYKYFK